MDNVKEKNQTELEKIHKLLEKVDLLLMKVDHVPENIRVKEDGVTLTIQFDR